MQLTAIDGLVTGWTSHDDGPGLVAFDADTGEVAWTHRATSFDNSAGMVESLGGSLVAISPFGGAWIELVDASGTTVATLDAPAEGYVAPDQLTALADGRLLATGRVEGGGGMYYTFVEVP